MLSKIFSFGSRRTGKKVHDTESGSIDEIYTTRRPFPTLEKEEIRVLVFKDCERKGKTLLFDSKAFATELNQQDGSLDRNSDSDCSRKACDPVASEAKGNVSPFIRPSSQHSRPSHDAKMLGEMIFGSVAMTYKGPTVKVHEIRTPHQLLLSNVFALKPRIVMPNCCDGNDYLSSSGQVDSVLDESTRVDPDLASLTSQTYSPKDSTVLGSPSKPMAVPGSVPVVIEPDGDSGFTASVESSFLGEDLSSLYTSVSSCGSYHRRLHRSHVTSIDYSFGRKNEEPSEEVSPLHRRRPKLGFGIIFHLGESEEKSRALQGFFFAHFPLIESHTKRLRIAIENACFLKTRSFSSQVYEAVEAFRNNIYGLLAAPRLKEPVWLNMMTHSSYRPHLCDKFMFQLIDCLKVGNTKETNFFMASVLTAVLSYHLAWVPTVMPAGAAPSRAYLDKHSSKTLDLLAQSHPYNPLWAQLGDLYGAVGFPLKVAKTIVVGKDSALVNQVLNILSYFIRCTEVLEHIQNRRDDVLMSVDTSNGNSFEFVENSICSLCGKPYLVQECLLENSISSNGSQNHLKCKQNFEEALLTDVNRGANDKISINEDILQELCLGLANSSKHRDISNSSAVEKKLQCVGDLQLICKCEHNSNGFDKKVLKHLFKNVHLVPRKGSHSDSFQCYCCKELSNGCALEKETTFKCYCNTNFPILKQMRDPHHYGGLDKHQDSKLCKRDCWTCATNGVTTNCSINESQDLSAESLERTDTSASKADSCISEEVDIDSVKCNGTFEKNEKEETVSSYGRSGSADSGIFQSPLNSPVVQRSVDFLGNDHDELDDDELPVELVLPRIVNVKCCPHPNSSYEEWKSYNNFGRSLFAGICDSYIPDLVLQGVQDKDFIMKLSSDLKMTVQHSVVDDPVSEAVCIIADTDRWTCEVVTVKKNKKQQLASDPVLFQPVEVSNLVHSMLTSLTGLWDIKMSADFCLIHLEDKLKEIYLKSKVITERVRDRTKLLSRDDLTKMLSVDDSDLPLLLAVASTHSPHNTPFMS